MSSTAAHQHAADFTGFDKLRYLDFIVTGDGSARAVWSGDDGEALGNLDKVLPERRLVVRRIQTNIQSAVTVIGGSGSKTITIDDVQPPTTTGLGNILLSLTALTLNIKKNDSIVDFYSDQIDNARPQIRFHAVAAIGNPTGWTGQIRCRLGYQMVHKFADLPDSEA